MIRRRRRVREIPFSFDSFLDIVANVVGIIIRLILVVWVGARSYSSLQKQPPPAQPNPEASLSKPLPADPLQDELEKQRLALREAQERLLAQLRQLQAVQEEPVPGAAELAALTARRQQLAQEETTLKHAASQREGTAKQVVLTSAEIQRRSQKLTEEILALEKLPPLKKTLHYRTPISKPVQLAELMFECKGGRVTFIDIASLLSEARQGMEDRAKEELRIQWQYSSVTGAQGAFRLRYTLERERGMLDGPGGDGSPSGSGSFRYGLSEYHLEPVLAPRGETGDAALAEGSEFRQIVEKLDPQQTAVTFWVYPDSFDLFRRLRDYLYDRDVLIAGRPLPDGVPIGASQRGSVSRGQ
jgi:hypothetical protein